MSTIFWYVTNPSSTFEMISQPQVALLSALLSSCIADYHTDHSGASNYIYPDYQGYGYAATGYDNYNTSVATFDSRKRRVFDASYSLSEHYYILNF